MNHLTVLSLFYNKKNLPFIPKAFSVMPNFYGVLIQKAIFISRERLSSNGSFSGG